MIPSVPYEPPVLAEHERALWVAVLVAAVQAGNPEPVLVADRAVRACRERLPL